MVVILYLLITVTSKFRTNNVRRLLTSVDRFRKMRRNGKFPVLQILSGAVAAHRDGKLHLKLLYLLVLNNNKTIKISFLKYDFLLNCMYSRSLALLFQPI